MSSWLPYLPLLLPLLTGVSAGLLHGDSRRRGRVSAAGCASAFVAVALMAFLEPVAGTPLTERGASLVLVLLTTGIGTVVLGYAGRYLSEDAGSRRFFPAAGLLVSACSGVSAATTLLGFAVCWSLAGLGLWLLLGVHDRTRIAPRRPRRVAVPLVVGEACLWTGVLLVVTTHGDLTLGAHADAAGTEASAVMLAVAALCRSALVPFHGWLLATLQAPTPVSALLHAGYVNAGAVLVLRLGDLVGSTPVALGLLLVAGGVSAVAGTATMLVRPDTKGALASSTVGQMGFLLFTAALGLHAAALVHLVLHGVYKAAMFLDAGSAVHRRHTAVRVRRGGHRIATVTVAVTLALALGLVHRALPAPGDDLATSTMLVFAWAALVPAGALLVARGGLPLPVVTLALAATGAGYLAATHTGHHLVAATHTVAAAAPVLPSVAALVAALALASAVRRRSPLVGRLHETAYVAAMSLAAGEPSSRRRPPATTPTQPRHHPAPLAGAHA